MGCRPHPEEDSVASLKNSILRHVRYSLAREWAGISSGEIFQAVALAVRDRLVERMLATEASVDRSGAKRLYYLSVEFLLGDQLGNNLLNLHLYEDCRQALRELGVNLHEIEEAEFEPALGNGGLGRLAACFLDSMATLGMPGYGYGINYEYGLFRQEIEGGAQRERPDNWLAYGTPWEVERPEETCLIPLYGHVEHGVDRYGHYNPMWLGWQHLIGVPHDILVPGYGGRTVTFLRLFSARSSREFDMQIFNEGDYFRAVEQKIASETVSKVLYPSDTMEAGQELRLVQEYFLVACAVRDIVRRYRRFHGALTDFASKVAIQLNDTHPALAVAELMRILVDENDLGWEDSWDIAQATFGYTNHTLMPEALEKWPVTLFERVLPRHLQIIYEVNRQFLEKVAAVFPGDVGRLTRMSQIEETPEKQVRMAHLAIVASHSVNGVSRMHTELLKERLAYDFVELWPRRFNNKTNGVTPRRWILKANPGLAELLCEAAGEGWLTHMERLRALDSLAADPGFRNSFRKMKRSNKLRLARYIKDLTRVSVDPDSLFDVHVKRIHQYKRQLLNVMHVLYVYFAAVEDGDLPRVPRTWIFGGKAAPGYWAAKQIIRLIHHVGGLVNRDRRLNDSMKVVFLPDYRVSLAEVIIPASDLSEQVSTVGTEASGTGNMKFAMNGALTICTPDGANIELMEEVGQENAFPFGLMAGEAEAARYQPDRDPRTICSRDPRLARVIEAFRSGRLSPREPGLFDWIWSAVMSPADPYLHVADLPSYLEAHGQAAECFRQPEEWTRRSILNVTRSGRFSSDRAVSEYAREIWNLAPLDLNSARKIEEEA
ncbi:MAG: glycogen/starch/alpha-glucan phosphorylase [Bryobacteraceae bacterium]